MSNTLNPTYPDGLDIEIFSMKALTQAWKKSKTNQEKEHVTKYLKESDKIKNLVLRIIKTILTLDGPWILKKILKF